MTQEGDVYRAIHATRRRTTLTGGIDDTMRIQAKRAKRTRWRAGNSGRHNSREMGAQNAEQSDNGDQARSERGEDTPRRREKQGAGAGRGMLEL
jgi:hypothetical protein